MKTTSKIIVAFFSIALLSCNSGGMKKTESGLEYQIHIDNPGDVAASGDIMTLGLVYKTDTDSILFNSSEVSDSFQVVLVDPSFKGGVEEGFAMMSPGDSMTFYCVADSIFNKTFGAELPPYIKSGSKLRFDVKLKSFISRADYDNLVNAKNEKLKNTEMIEIQNYLKDQNINVQSTQSGLYYVEVVKGKGSRAENGKTVSVHYTGMFTDGKKFDSSLDRNDPLVFALGEGAVIPGWEEGISMMNVGGKARLVIPSNLAYGPQGSSGVIPPYSPLVFEVELLEVK